MIVTIVVVALTGLGLAAGVAPAGAQSRSATVRRAVAAPTAPVVTAAVAKTKPKTKPKAKPPRLPNAAGSIDSALATSSSSIRVRGWTLNPRSAAPLAVAVSVDTRWTLAYSTSPRPDLAAAFPFLGGNHGYDLTLAATPGAHFVCVVAGGSGVTLTILGCRVVTVSGGLPFGSYDDVSVSAAQQVRVSGWAIDPDITAPVTIGVQVDGADQGSGAAAITRGDLAPFGLGTEHGYAVTAPVPLGVHQVCVTAQDVGGTATVPLGCRSVNMPQTNPTGSIDSVSVSGTSVVVGGWANDPDGSGPSTVTVAVTSAGFDDPASVTAVAQISRPDVAAALGVPANRGYGVSVPDIGPGTHGVCVGVHNQNFGADVLIGCQTITVIDHRPTGSVDSVTPVAGGFGVAGWMADPDAATSVTVRVVVDGVTHATVANLSRPDVGAATPYGSNRGFGAQVTGLSAGLHTVCVVATDIGGGVGLSGDRSFPCGSVVVSSTLAAATTGAPGGTSPVGPAAGNPLAGIDRDAGVSVGLRDGSTLWLFGDSMIRNADGSVRSFAHDTAAWAPAGQPTVTRDGSSGGQPVAFVTPGGGFPACANPAGDKAMWPMSAVKVTDGAVDRVYVYMANVCVIDSKTFEFHGTALVEWDYNPAAPPDGQPIQGHTLSEVLLGGTDQAEAATIGTDGNVYVYGCDGPINGGWPTEYGPCRVERVAPSQIGVASAYRYWTGTAWTGTTAASAAPLNMPNGADGVLNLPPGGFSVTWDPANQIYEMVYSPWPGFTDQLAIRVAASPQGPWSGPMIVTLLGCDDTVGGVGYFCYAAGAQPQFSSAGQLGVGYYDQMVAVGPNRGAYLATTVPFSVLTN
jgi:hypothetical protein